MKFVFCWVELNAQKSELNFVVGFQIWDDTVKERGACALWSLAGDHPQQQRAIANRIGTKQIIEMLISKSDILQFIGKFEKDGIEVD